MKIELFLDDINRDIFTTTGVMNGNWKDIYRDHVVHPTPTDQAKNINWRVKICIRREDEGGLLFDATNNRVFKLDQEAYEELSILWVTRKVSDVVKIRSEENYSALENLLKEHKLAFIE